MEDVNINLPLDHIGIAVISIVEATAKYQQLMHAEILHDEEVPSQGVKVRFLSTGSETKIELLEALGPESPVAKFVDKRGEGLHHIAFRVHNIYEEFERLTEEGFQILQKEPVRGAYNKLIFFIHPKSMGGTLVEICQPL